MGVRFKREGTYVRLWLILVDAWQKSNQYCKAIIPQLKISKILKISLASVFHGQEMIFTLEMKDNYRKKEFSAETRGSLRECFS